MPYCPKCRGEFQDWVKTCPDCRVALVAELPASSRSATRASKERLLHIADAPNEPVGEMWAEILKEHGIQCMTKGGKAPGDMSGNSPSSACEIYVLVSDAPRARRILDSLPDSKRHS